MRKIKLLLLLISSFLFSHVNAIKFSGIEVPEGWNTASYKNSCDEIVVFVFDKSKKLNIYKIYLEEIPNNKEEVKIRIAYKFDRFFLMVTNG